MNRSPMRTRIATAAALVAVALVGAFAVCAPSPGAPGSAGPSGTPMSGLRATDGEPCVLPTRVATPSWLPSDLPLPPGTYPTWELGEGGGFSKLMLAVPGMDTVAFRAFVESSWPAAGWEIGPGESELGETENWFRKPPAAGTFIAQDQYCRPGFVRVLISYRD